jgi:hypothetical protein
VRIWVHGEVEQSFVGGGEKVSVGSSIAEDAVEREREKKCAETEKKLVFLADFLFSQVINEASIYKQWKRVISSTPR